METVSPRIVGCDKSSLVEIMCDHVSAWAKERALVTVSTAVVGCTREVGAAAGPIIYAYQSNGMAEAMKITVRSAKNQQKWLGKSMAERSLMMNTT
jgi:hypothetical protein